MARSRAKARLNWVSQGQRWGRCRVRRRAERVMRPARARPSTDARVTPTSCFSRPLPPPGLHETPSDWTHLPTSGLAVFRPLYTL